VNFLLFRVDDAAYDAALQERPPVMTLAWPRPEQDLAAYVRRARAAGSRVMVMAGGVPEARRAVAAGAEIVIAQGTEGGGHVSWMGTMPLVPMVVDAVAPLPVLAAGGIADGRGLAAALALGAQGVLIGTRFLASVEAPLHPNFKQAILESDGHDTVLTEIPDTLRGQIWPGAMARAQRNRFIARWAGREWALRAALSEESAAVESARLSGDADNAYLLIGQDAGLIHDLPPAKVLIERMLGEAETILRDRLPALVS
jgi:NAD(P)H-dependent flavin oxidoreductase YrpB (nitropropane dioxygenase family)